MISQQYYTREKRGLFRNSEGYDTIAKSSQLSESFVKDSLHPLCFYDVPKKAGESMPDADFCVNLPTGELIIGRSTYIPKDFTGERSTFFTHNYVIPKKEKEPFLRENSKIFSIKTFVKSYDSSLGIVLPAIDDVETHKINNFFNDKDTYFPNKDMFKRMLYAAFVAASSATKLYIIPNVASSKIGAFSKNVMRLLYAYIPDTIKDKIHFITYVRQPVQLRFNIQFVEKGNISSKDPALANDMVIDYESGSFKNIDYEDSAYLEYCWQCLSNNKFTTTINFIKYFKNSIDLYSLKLYNYATTLVKVSDADKESLTAPYIKSCIDILDIVEKDSLSMPCDLYDHLLNFLSQNNFGVSTIKTVFDNLMKRPSAFEKFVDKIYDRELVHKAIAPYLNNKDFEDLNALINEITYWFNKSPKILLEESVQNIFFGKETKLFNAVKDKMAVFKSMDKNIEQYQCWIEENDIPDKYSFKIFFSSLRDKLTSALLSTLDFKSLSHNDIINVDFDYPDQATSSVYSAIQLCKSLYTCSNSGDISRILAEAKLAESFWVPVKDKVKDYYKGKVTPRYYSIVTFCIDDLLARLDYIKSNDGNVQRYIVWAIYTETVDFPSMTLNSFTNGNVSTPQGYLRYAMKHKTNVGRALVWAVQTKKLNIATDQKLILQCINRNRRNKEFMREIKKSAVLTAFEKKYKGSFALIIPLWVWIALVILIITVVLIVVL